MKSKHNFFLSISLVLIISIFTSLYYEHTYKIKASSAVTKREMLDTDNGDNEDDYLDYDDDDTDDVIEETHGIWLSFFDYSSSGYTKSSFTKFIQKTFDTCVDNNYNAVFVHTRMFADAMYKSKYFPWSKYCSGKQGKNPGFDPLKIMVTEAHERGLSIHAWINPYRITSNTTSYKNIAKSSYAYKWAHSSKASKRRNVLKFNGSLYFNPAKTDVINLISNGVKEIVKNYDVDGIHFDDYFYPELGDNYKKVFDSKEYNSYKSSMQKKKQTPLGIIKWRRENVNKLIKTVYSTINKTRYECLYGISPAGSLNNLYYKSSYYCDVKKWMKSDKYIDYICPQIYWSFDSKTTPYKKVCQEWVNIPRSDTVELYIGLAAYKAGISQKQAKALGDTGWSKSNTVLKDEVIYARNTKNVDGFVVFDYSDINRKAAKKEMANLKKLFADE